MRNSHLQSGGRYPVLRSLAIIYLYLSGAFAVGGVVLAGYLLFHGWIDPALPFTNHLADRLMQCALALAGTALVVLSMLAVAELLKLFIDIEHNTRMAAGSSATVQEVSMSAGGKAEGRLNRITVLEGEETAEGALLRGH